jgi:hypothetical protein
LRFGNISIAAAEIKRDNGYRGPSFVVDTHSRTGYSGSPVFVFRTPGSIFARQDSIMGGGHILLLLGVHWGQFPERWELTPTMAPVTEGAEASLITDGHYVLGLSGMTCVAPAWELLRLLKADPVAQQRREVEERIARA